MLRQTKTLQRMWDDLAESARVPTDTPNLRCSCWRSVLCPNPRHLTPTNPSKSNPREYLANPPSPSRAHSPSARSQSTPTPFPSGSRSPSLTPHTTVQPPRPHPPQSPPPCLAPSPAPGGRGLGRGLLLLHLSAAYSTPSASNEATDSKS